MSHYAPGPYSWRGDRANQKQSMFYDNVQAHIALMEKQHNNETAALLRLYEAERERQQTAIKNLEDQLTRLANQSLSQANLREILSRAGMDLDVIIESDKIFGGKKSEPEGEWVPHHQSNGIWYCRHGNMPPCHLCARIKRPKP